MRGGGGRTVSQGGTGLEGKGVIFEVPIQGRGAGCRHELVIIGDLAADALSTGKTTGGNCTWNFGGAEEDGVVPVGGVVTVVAAEGEGHDMTPVHLHRRRYCAGRPPGAVRPLLLLLVRLRPTGA